MLRARLGSNTRLDLPEGYHSELASRILYTHVIWLKIRPDDRRSDSFLRQRSSLHVMGNKRMQDYDIALAIDGCANKNGSKIKIARCFELKPISNSTVAAQVSLRWLSACQGFRAVSISNCRFRKRWCARRKSSLFAKQRSA